jgi:hypothetical protein
LQFGKTTVTGVFSEQKSQTKTVTAQGGGTIQDFDFSDWIMMLTDIFSFTIFQKQIRWLIKELSFY